MGKLKPIAVRTDAFGRTVTIYDTDALLASPDYTATRVSRIRVMETVRPDDPAD